ncbi:unnamed protein product [Ectocarpus sp. 12 AP-2014]
MYPLDRAPAEMEPPIDPLHPGRYFLDPPCRSAETDQSFDTGGAEGGDIVTKTFKLPPVLTCDRCVLQMMYYVSNACVHPGYATFESDDWPSGCAPTKHDWISEGMAVCGTEGSTTWRSLRRVPIFSLSKTTTPSTRRQARRRRRRRRRQRRRPLTLRRRPLPTTTIPRATARSRASTSGNSAAAATTTLTEVKPVARARRACREAIRTRSACLSMH